MREGAADGFGHSAVVRLCAGFAVSQTGTAAARQPPDNRSPVNTDLFDLTGQVAIVTGASSGLGARFATVLAEAGATVVAVARRADRLTALATTHEHIAAMPCDLVDDAAREQLVADVMGTWGRIDVLVNNAGMLHVTGPAERASIADFRRVVDLNLTALFGLTSAAAAPMLAAGSGSIINVASVFGLVGSAPLAQASYTASKGAVVNLTRQLAGEWAPHGVRVNAIAPGFFPSELTTEVFEDARTLKWVERNTPMGRTGRDGELDGTLLLLAGDAGSYITGQVIAVDGGWTSR